ncbi:MAG TPA: ribosome biogenesis GTPase YlqF, partial [Polyangia bacterium]|nr:ribosome biogenesis GTPase YlqF [Polyangia bacterium]
MSIRWFPGHMIAARKKAAESMRATDLVIEVLDARVPRASCNPTFEALRHAGQKPALKLLNKSDLADPEQTRLWLRHYNAQPGVQ